MSNKLTSIILISGIFEEADSVLANAGFDFVFDMSIRCWKSEYKGSFIYLFNAGAAFRNKKEFRKLLNNISYKTGKLPDILINFGLAGGLRSAKDEYVKNDYFLKSGETVLVCEILNTERKKNHLRNAYMNRMKNHWKSVKCISVNELIYSPDAKLDLFLETGAEICDMELYHLYQFLDKEFTILKTRLLSLKLISDMPEDYWIYRNEQQLRGYKKQKPFRKLKMILSYPDGPLNALKLVARKNKLYKQLGVSVKELVEFLI